MPLHRSRLRQRGYNQALELARPLARELGVPLRHDVLQRLRRTDAQTELDAIGRRQNVRGAFALRPGIELPAHVAILDDVTAASIDHVTLPAAAGANHLVLRNVNGVSVSNSTGLRDLHRDGRMDVDML